MLYEIDLASVQREMAAKVGIVYRFRIASGLSTAYCNVLLTHGGVDIIEQRGKDSRHRSEDCFRAALEGWPRPFSGSILINIPFGHAAHFAKYRALADSMEKG